MTAQIYERLSSIHDLDLGKWSRQYIAMIQEILPQLGVSPAKILDLACGTGTLALELAKLGHSVLGVDISPQMIEVAKSKAANLSNVSFQVSDMSDFNYPKLCKEAGIKADSTKKISISDLYKIWIDNKTIAGLQWYRTNSIYTNQQVMIATVPLDTIRSGYRELKINKIYLQTRKKKVKLIKNWDVIPFEVLRKESNNLT